MTLEEYLKLENLTFDDVLDREDESAYWNTCIQFVGSNLKKDMAKMTLKQADWISKIIDGVKVKTPLS